MRVLDEGFDKGKAIASVSYKHEAMIEQILAQPELTQKKLAEIFGLTEGWVSRVVNSDAFQVRLAEKRQALTDPAIARTMNERLEGFAHQAVELVQKKLEQTDSAAYALEALGLATKALGMGVKAHR